MRILGTDVIMHIAATLQEILDVLTLSSCVEKALGV
jgi:hypothetical protein